MEQVAKRRRIALACVSCRARKTRCDGAQPKCSTCVDFNFDCTYKQQASASNVIIGKEYLGEVEARLATAETHIRDLQATVSRQQLVLNGIPADAGHANQSDSHPSRVPDTPDSCLWVHNLQDPDVSFNEVDGVGAIEFGAKGARTYFGPSSNISLVRQISRIVAQSMRRSCPPQEELRASQMRCLDISRPPSRGRDNHMQDPIDNAGAKPDLLALPPDARVMELVEIYFKTTGLLFPFIHEATFRKDLNGAREKKFSTCRRSLLGLLNTMMAMAARTTVNGQSPEARMKESTLYYSRSSGLMEMRLARVSRFDESLPPLQREFRKRTWYACVLLDRTMGMTLGRPFTIPEDHIVIPLPCPLQPSESNDASNGKDELAVGFFNSTLLLYKIVDQIIKQLYGSNIGVETATSAIDCISSVLQAEQQLGKWQRDLPPGLALQSAQNIPEDVSDAGNHASERLRTILTLRYHNVRLLAHRPILSRLLDSIYSGGTLSPDSQQLSVVGSSSIQSCAQSAMEIISIMSTVTSSTRAHRQLLGAWWFSLYYLFNASLVIFGCLLLARTSIATSHGGATTIPNKHELQSFLRDAQQVLSELDPGNRMVDRCAEYLDKLISISNILSGDTDAMGASLDNLLGSGHEFNNGWTGQTPYFLDDLLPDSSCGADLGGFLLQGDVDFVNHMVDATRSLEPPAINHDQG